jgi:predicted Zn-dependent protease
VTVRYRSSGDQFTGWTEWFWDDSGHLVHADITLNPRRIRAFDRAEQSCMRQHTTSHELGHALGLRHYPRTHSGSVMSYLGWRKRCGRLSAHDRSDFRELYPETAVQLTRS